MFKSLKYFIEQTIPQDTVVHDLLQFGYARVKSVSQAGEFALRGSIIDIFPVNFDAPVQLAPVREVAMV